MKTQLVFWQVLAPSKAPRDCDELNDGRTFRLESPQIAPPKEGAEEKERKAARLRFLEDSNKAKKEVIA
jgi:hypothetical protein